MKLGKRERVIKVTYTEDIRERPGKEKIIYIYIHYTRERVVTPGNILEEGGQPNLSVLSNLAYRFSYFKCYEIP